MQIPGIGNIPQSLPAKQPVGHIKTLKLKAIRW